VSVVGVPDIVNNATVLKGQYFNLSFITGAAVFFLVITIPLTRCLDYLIRRDQARMRAA
jgi:ABC-type amino acid transport system permease subunit